METVDVKEKDETKKRVSNKYYGYISYETAESAHLQGFGSFPRPLVIDFYFPKDKRKIKENMPPSGFNFMEQGMMFSPFQGYQFQMFRIPFPNQFNIWQQGNFPNRGYKVDINQNIVKEEDTEVDIIKIIIKEKII